MRHSKPSRFSLSSAPVPSLGATLLIAVLLPFISATVLTGWYSITSLEKQTRTRMQEDIELIARALQLPISHALERGHEGTVQRALDSAFSIDRVYGVYLYDRDGRPLALSGGDKAAAGSGRAARIAAEGERRGGYEQAGGEEVFSYYVPLLEAGGRINGLLQVTRRGSDFDRYLADVRSHAAVVVSVAGLLLIGIVLLGHRWTVGRHLGAVDAGLRRVGEGDLAHRFALRGPRELRMLAAGINHMLEAIVRSRAELARQRAREKALTERLHQSEKMAALGQLAAGVAHELGSPLSTVDGKAQRLLRRTDLPETVVRGLEAIRREAGRMERIIRQLLDFGRTNPLTPVSVPAERPLRSAAARLREEGAGSGVAIECAAQTDGCIEVDAVRLEQALGNLLRNALQAASSRVEAGCRLEGDRIIYWVDDDGPGIPEAIRSHLFEPFFTTKPIGEGTGLGLAVAHAAARDHRGEIRLAESRNGGARFELSLPVRPEESADE